MSKSLKLALLFSIAIFLVQTASAYTYLNIYIDSTGKAQFLGETNETNLILPPGVLVQNGKISGFTQALTSKSGEIWTFSYSLKDSEIKAILPDGARIESLSNPSAEIFLERGRISIYYTDSLAVKYVLDNKQGNSNLLLIITTIIIIGVFVGYINRNKIRGFLKPKIIYKKSRQKQTKEHTDHHHKIELIKQVLNEREKKILETLQTHERIKMSQLRKLTEIPKASFSRHVQELEKKGILRRSGEGKNKFVELVKYDFYSG